MEANWDIGPVKVTYLPAFRTWQQNDHVFVDPNFISSGVPLNQTLRTPNDNFHTQELRVASKDDAAIKWQGGVFYYRNNLNKFNHDYLVSPSGGELAVLSDTDDNKDTQNLGYFAETTLPLGASTRMTLGARYDDTKVTTSEFFYNDAYATCGTVAQFAAVLPPGVVCTGVAQASVPSPPGVSLNGVVLNFHNFNYKARLEQDLTPKNLLYGMVSTGFRPGDAGITFETGAGGTQVGTANILNSEKLTSIEVGSKNRFLDDSLQANAAVYFYNYHGFQTSYIPYVPGVFTALGMNNTVNVTVPAHNIGGELELLYLLTAHDRFGLNYDYVQSRWYDKSVAFAQAQPETVRALTPYTITANYEHAFNLSGGSTFTARIDGRFEAAHLGANLQEDWLQIGYEKYVYLGSRTIGNLTGTWASNGGRYLISAYVRNFTNTQYLTYGVTNSQATLPVARSDPRTYGAMASVRF
jgi:outer membrane receptor protein involved in Fe transport